MILLYMLPNEDPAIRALNSRPNKNWKRIAKDPVMSALLSMSGKMGYCAYKLTQTSNKWRGKQALDPKPETRVPSSETRDPRPESWGFGRRVFVGIQRC